MQADEWFEREVFGGHVADRVKRGEVLLGHGFSDGPSPVTPKVPTIECARPSASMSSVVLMSFETARVGAVERHLGAAVGDRDGVVVAPALHWPW